MPTDGERSSNSSYINECCIIGCLMKDPDTLADVERILTIADFESEICKETYQAVLGLRDGGKPFDMILVRAEMKRRTGEDTTQFILECIDMAPTTANVTLYCLEVKRDANSRRAARISRDIDRAVFDGAEADEIVELAQSKIDEIEQLSNCEVSDSRSSVSRFCDYYRKVKENPDIAFCKTGYSSLNRRLGGGMFNGGMYIVGARPGMGKTTLGINIAENIVTVGNPIMFVSLEMTEPQIVAKRMSCNAGIPYTSLLTGSLSQAAEKEMGIVADVLSERPFNLISESRMSVVDIGRSARKIKNLSAIVVDYLGLVSVSEEQQKKPRYEQMTNISADIKALAKLLNIPIVVLCQLNRENTKSTSKRPQLQDLRDSGAIEQDADAVVLLHRPEYYSEEKEKSDYIQPEIEKIELIIAKNRHAGTGTVEMQWRGKTGEISEVDTVHNDV